MAPPRSCQRRATGSHSTRPRFLGTRRRPTTRSGSRSHQTATGSGVGARSRARSTPRQKLSSTTFETLERSIRARSFARTPQLYATVRYASSRYSPLLHGHGIDHMHLEETIANTDSAKEIRRRAVMKNAARLVSKAVFCCKIYTRSRVSNDDLISTKGT